MEDIFWIVVLIVIGFVLWLKFKPDSTPMPLAATKPPEPTEGQAWKKVGKDSLEVLGPVAAGLLILL